MRNAIKTSKPNLFSKCLVNMFTVCSFLYMPFIGLANNVQISNVTLTNDSTLSFSISWENSWRITTSPPNNHDAVWIFIKSKNCASLQWQHVNISKTPTSHNAGSPLEVYIDTKDSTSNAAGLFLRRDTDGSGDIANVQVSIIMDALPMGQYDFKVFSIEMVQIPEGPFYLGDVAGTNRFKDGGSANPYYVDSETGHVVGNTAGLLGYSAYTNSYDLPSTSTVGNSLYPKGYAEFYCMKYELSQGQYIDFLNTLTSAQYANIYQIDNATSTTYRFAYTGAYPVMVATTPHRAACYVKWTDLLAYLDWAALRPMTEMQYEKACRGPDYPVANEFAWGSDILTDANTLTAGTNGTPSESVTDAITAGGGIMSYGSTTNGFTTIKGPLRCGFAANSTSTRLTSGASYYGVLELSGNIIEQTVNCSSFASSYNGNVGDGILTVGTNAGFSNQGWPYEKAYNNSSSAGGRALKGGSFLHHYGYSTVSDRVYAGNFENRKSIAYYFGGRGIR